MNISYLSLFHEDLKILWLVIVIVPLLFLSSCEEENTPELIPTRIALSPDEATINEGEEQTFTASVYDQEDNEMPDHTVNWTSSEEAVATINSQGVATGVDAGESTINASVSGLNAIATLTVIPLIIPARIEIEPASSTIPEGGEESFTATVFDQNNEEIENSTIVWTSSDESVATVDDEGLVNGIEDGEAIISAKVGEITAAVTIQVTAEEPVVTSIIVSPETITVDRGENVVFSATVLDQFEREMEGVAVEWQSPFPCVASIDEEGSSYGYSTGSTPIIARAEGVEGSGTLEVASLPEGSPESMDGEWLMCYEDTGQFLYNFYLEHDLDSEVFNNLYQEFTGTFDYVFNDNTRPIDIGRWYVSGDQFVALNWQFILRGGLRTAFISEMEPVNEFHLKGILVLPEGLPGDVRIVKALELE
jgi:uncharacterized protein YjdB